MLLPSSLLLCFLACIPFVLVLFVSLEHLILFHASVLPPRNDFFCEGSWPLCSLPNFVRKLCHVCATDSGFHITFHSKSAFFHHTPLCHDSAQCNAMNAHGKLMLIPVLPTHSSTNYKASKYVSLPHHILYKKSNLMESCSCADLCYSITKE
jgi:hypothetical protein